MSGTERYARFFPKAWATLKASCSTREVVGYIDVLMQYMQREGDLPADNKLLATVAGLTMKEWLALSERLLALGIARIEEGRWVDVDQQQNLQRQLDFSESQRIKALKKQAIRGVFRA